MKKKYKGYVACTFGGGNLPPSFYHRPKKAANSNKPEEDEEINASNSNGDTIKVPMEFFKNKKAFLAKKRADEQLKKIFKEQND